jgi:hypothetical protein
MQIHQLIFFIIGLLVAIPVLVHYYRRVPRRFRPKLGEMAMVSLFAVLLCGAGALLMGSFLDDPDQYKVQDDLAVAPAGDLGTAGLDGQEETEKSKRSLRRTDRGQQSEPGPREETRSRDRGERDRRE